MLQRSLLLLFLFCFTLPSNAQDKSGCGENLYYNFKYNGQLIKEERGSPYYSYKISHEILVHSIDTITLSASSGGGSCFFCLGPLERNSVEIDVFEHRERSNSGWVKFMGKPGDYFIRACATQSFGYSHSISFKITLYQPGAIDPELQSTGLQSLTEEKNSRPNPVPFCDFLNIEINENKPPIKVSMINTMGQTIYLNNRPSTDFVINVSHLNKGLYIVRYHYPEYQETFKAVKN